MVAADIDTWMDEARGHQQGGDLDRAASAYRRVLHSRPAHVDALIGLADLLDASGQGPEALGLLEEGVARVTDSAALLERLANARQARGQPEKAIGAYRRAVQLEPNRVGSWWGLGCALASTGDHAAAAESLSRLATLQPGFGEGFHNLGRSLYELGQVDEACLAFQAAYERLSPEARTVPLTNLAMIIPGAPGADNQSILDRRRAWDEHCLPRGSRSRAFPDHRDTRGRLLRLGYVSAYFDRRNWMKPVWGLINHHDRGKFEIHLFADGPRPSPEDGFAGDPRDRFHESGGLSNTALARLVEESQIDLLIDLNGYSRPPRLGLFALRPVPVQVAWFNMFATSGLTEIDYLVGDGHVLPPGDERFCTEHVVRLPGSYLTFEVGYRVPDVTPPPCTTRGYLTFGCLAPQYKITPRVVEAWSRILGASPTSRMVLKNTILEQPAARDFVRDLFARFSIDAGRLDLDGPAEHYDFLQRYADIDLALDTFPYNGGTTTMEALWQGVPVLTFVGDRWASRISASLIREAGLPEFVAPDLEHHIHQAIDLALSPGTPHRLAELRASMRERLTASSVCDVGAFARRMEEAYLAMWQSWIDGTGRFAEATRPA